MPTGLGQTPHGIVDDALAEIGRRRHLAIATSDVPVPIEEVETAMAWHASHHDDPAHRWLRDRVFEAAATMR